MKESQIQKNIIAYLQYLENAHKLYFIRNNVFAGQIRRSNGSIGYMRTSKAGVSDIILFLPDGRTVFVEVKSEKGDQSDLQLAFQERIVRLGYQYIIVRSLEEMQRFIEAENK